ncbi:MAG: TerC family protein [Sedimentisphaerales bacterium]|nr:TerC family protein [Sedimentisphaerales bacterium]
MLYWMGFLLLVIGLLALDLGVFHRKAHSIGVREALAWTAFWITLALAFNVVVYFAYEHSWLNITAGAGQVRGGRDAALKYFTGYVIEKSLSLDNIFVMALLFSYFAVPRPYQHRVLFWGILGAIGMRAIMIAAGSALIERFSWTVYLFGAILILTAGKLLIGRQEIKPPDRNPLVRLARRIYPVTEHYDGPRFFGRINGARAITPMFLVLLAVESSDVMFAVDSIPAIFAVTTDPFIIFTSNVFAILGLRSLYFALAAMIHRFRYVRQALVLVLLYVGIKMLLSHHYPIETWISLLVIVSILAAALAASRLFGPAGAAGPAGPPADPEPPEQKSPNRPSST